MTDSRHNPTPDLLDQATRQLLEQPLPPMPPAERLAGMARTLEALEARPPRRSILERIRTMNPWKRYTLAAATFAIAFGAVSFILLGTNGRSIAFADVKKALDEAKTIKFRVRMKMAGFDHEITTQMWMKQPGLIRQEAAVTVPGRDQPIETVSVIDLTGKKGTTLIPSEKRAMTIAFGDMSDELSKHLTEQKWDFLGQIRKALDEGKKEELGEKTFDGIKAKGYRITSTDANANSLTGGYTMELWVDAKTAEPLRIEMSLPTMQSLVMDQFEINEPMDDDLFKLDIPSDYSVKEMPKLALDFKEASLAPGLEIMAQLNGGAFPDMPNMGPTLLQRLQETTPEPQEAQMKMQVMTNAFMSLSLLPAVASDYRWVGGGVKLGDADKPILYWKLKDTDTYRLMTGDLKIRDAAAAEIKAIKKR